MTVQQITREVYYDIRSFTESSEWQEIIYIYIHKRSKCQGLLYILSNEITILTPVSHFPCPPALEHYIHNIVQNPGERNLTSPRGASAFL